MTERVELKIYTVLFRNAGSRWIKNENEEENSQDEMGGSELNAPFLRFKHLENSNRRLSHNFPTTLCRPRSNA